MKQNDPSNIFYVPILKDEQNRNPCESDGPGYRNGPPIALFLTCKLYNLTSKYNLFLLKSFNSLLLGLICILFLFFFTKF